MADVEECVKNIVKDIFNTFDTESATKKDEKVDQNEGEQINTDSNAKKGDDRLSKEEFKKYVEKIIEDFGGVMEEKEGEEKKEDGSKVDDDDEEKTCVFDSSQFDSCFAEMLRLEKESHEYKAASEDVRNKWGETLSQTTVAKFLKKEAGYGE